MFLVTKWSSSHYYEWFAAWVHQTGSTCHTWWNKWIFVIYFSQHFCETVAIHLNYQTNCERWSLCSLITNKKKTYTHMSAALFFFKSYSKDLNGFLTQVVTGNETWISYTTLPGWTSFYTMTSPLFTIQTQKFKQAVSTLKVMATVFWKWKGPLLVEFMLHGITMNVDMYSETLKKMFMGLFKIAEGACCLVAFSFSMAMHGLMRWIKQNSCL